MRFFVKNSLNQKKRDVHKISARNSGAGNGCANFMDAWHFWVLSAGKNPHAHKIPPFRGGSWFFWKGGGWKCRFYFYGRGDFSDSKMLRDIEAGNRASCPFSRLLSIPPLPCCRKGKQKKNRHSHAFSVLWPKPSCFIV